MKSRKVTQYACDFCKKRGLSAPHMRKHERSCTNNPDRVCGFCGRNGDVSELVAAAREGLEAVKHAADYCPACMLAGIRPVQREMFDALNTEEGPVSSDNPTLIAHDALRAWDFKQAKAEWWSARNDELREMVGNCEAWEY